MCQKSKFVFNETGWLQYITVCLIFCTCKSAILWHTILTSISSQPYLHESRHQHAIRRARGNGGRFAKKTEVEASNHMNEEKDMGTGQVPLSRSISSSGFGSLPSDSAETWNSPSVQQGARGSQVHERFEERNYANVLQSSSTFCLHSGERVEEGDCSGQQRGSILSEHTSQRRLAIQ